MVESVAKGRKCHQGRVCYIKVENDTSKQHQGRKCNIKEGNAIKIENASHQSRKYNVKIENVF